MSLQNVYPWDSICPITLRVAHGDREKSFSQKRDGSDLLAAHRVYRSRFQGLAPSEMIARSRGGNERDRRHRREVLFERKEISGELQEAGLENQENMLVREGAWYHSARKGGRA